MSLFPRFDRDFAPLFRMLDDFDTRHATRSFPAARSFSPKFDVKELNEAYELHGEFPGIEQKNISIEWTDANTLTVSGRTEMVREEGQRPGAAAAIENNLKEEHHHKPTVEDEGAAPATETPEQDKSEVAKRAEGEGEVTKQDASASAPRYWVSERSVGEFHRSFAFPQRVDQDAVRASLRNGILSVVVPKARAQEPRKVAIEGS
ncbi:30 kd heat shock protein [Polyplosphaeria fusca]|uniref:30 kd heat shock protein n=1 Tax=Polyplosphaeria fusca TaxID=682080 RepID=A0A9P4R968_9PLEO|nr:30 kd heat shock protein [Polyplosphaeria fusca]